MEYKVPFLCVDKNMQVRRSALGYYIRNLMSADKFDIERAMPVIRDFIRKDKDILETNVPSLVEFLGKVGSKQIRKPTDVVKDPTKWFCMRLAKLLKAIKPKDYFLKRLGYAYVKASICHKWIQAFFEYDGPNKKALLESMTYAIMDIIDDDPYNKRGDDKGCLRIFYHIYEKITDPESLPVPLYLFLKRSRRTYEITDWHKFVRSNMNFGRNEKENDGCLKFLITTLVKKLEHESISYDERQSVIEGLNLLKKTRQSKYLADCLIKKLKSVKQRSQYLTYRQLIEDQYFSKSNLKKIDQRISLFAKTYEYPDNDLFFRKLSWKEKVMLYERFDKKKQRIIRSKCLDVFEKYTSLPYYKKELFYMFKILSTSKEFVSRYQHDKRLFSKSLESSKFRILYLERMHAVDGMFLNENKNVYSDDFYDDGSRTAVALSSSKIDKVIKYRCVIMTVQEEGDSFTCEVLSRKRGSKHSVYSAVKYSGRNSPKAIYPNIDKRMALFFAKSIFSSGRKDVFGAALEVHNHFSN